MGEPVGASVPDSRTTIVDACLTHFSDVLLGASGEMLLHSLLDHGVMHSRALVFFSDYYGWYFYKYLKTLTLKLKQMNNLSNSGKYFVLSCLKLKVMEQIGRAHV